MIGRGTSYVLVVREPLPGVQDPDLCGATDTQRLQVRSWKDKKAFTVDMKHIYNAPTQEAAKAALDDFAGKWGAKYSYAIKSWRVNWGDLTDF